MPQQRREPLQLVARALHGVVGHVPQRLQPVRGLQRELQARQESAAVPKRKKGRVPPVAAPLPLLLLYHYASRRCRYSSAAGSLGA